MNDYVRLKYLFLAAVLVGKLSSVSAQEPTLRKTPSKPLRVRVTSPRKPTTGKKLAKLEASLKDLIITIKENQETTRK